MNSHNSKRLNKSLDGIHLTETQSNDTQKRKAIQKIILDDSITDFERRKEIQELMNKPLPLSTSIISDAFVKDKSFLPENVSFIFNFNLSCRHYRRSCEVVTPCCGKIFGCRLCHDDCKSHDHPSLNRFKIKFVVCKHCLTKQNKSNICIRCGEKFGEYFCCVCNLWMPKDKEPFHCNSCGLCRVGGEGNFKHCHKCKMCISIYMYKNHNCIEDKYKRECPVCQDDLFISRIPSQDLFCGHAIHSHCLQKLSKFDYRCPICKKTVIHPKYLEGSWKKLANDIREQPMPKEFIKHVTITCNDCEMKSQNLNWHFLGTQCPKCRSFNTAVGD